MSFMLTHRYTAPLLLLLLTLLSLPVSAGAATLIVANKAEATVSLVSPPEGQAASTPPARRRPDGAGAGPRAGPPGARPPVRGGQVAPAGAGGTGPHEVAVSPSGRLALIANYGCP